MKALVIGATGTVGSRLADALQARGHTVQRMSRKAATDAERFDMLSPDTAIPDADVTFVCAAVTRFIDCEGNAEAWRINVDAPIALAKRAKYLVHLSSDAVERALHTAYGMQKAFAEMALAPMKNVLIVRLPRITQSNAQMICDQIATLGEQKLVGLQKL